MAKRNSRGKRSFLIGGIILLVLLFSFLIFLFKSSPPQILSASVYPEKVMPGQILVIKAEVKDNLLIKEIKASIETDDLPDRTRLLLVDGSMRHGIYERGWIVHDTSAQKWYNITITATNLFGKTASIIIPYQDPTQSHNASEIVGGTFTGNYTFAGGNVEIGRQSGKNEVNLSGVMYVNSTSGNVGIGTTGPQAKLDVTGNIKLGNQTMTGLCPSGWIVVPGNASLGTTDFCVMKYEAKKRDGVPQSILEQTPWVSIAQFDAAGNCTRIGAHLCTAKEALTISRNIEGQAANWKNNAIGTCLYGGHVDNSPGNAIAAGYDNDPYNGTSDSATDTFECPFNTGVGGSDGKEQRRTFNLSNGEIIWDWSGNVWEWLANTCTSGTGAGNWDEDAAWEEWTSSEFDDYERQTLGPSSSLWNANNGTGRYYGCTANGNTFRRGGAWDNGVSAGVFVLVLADAPSAVGTYVGFRCCMVP